ncbi:prolyl 4-hydroxylase subunit alpha-2-like [Scaptodrosophila lebanonensis]|uniref:procollagen-proline 4-dioxygenase n=1 Tax=Drosophila lebanonensis TaxID=7225 RepID=A0A6J2T5J8_DROLE|nr:prolyl 4-hydroxylase subunit alpha-2-like [Scaptodrosophila lebanonensis]
MQPLINWLLISSLAVCASFVAAQDGKNIPTQESQEQSHTTSVAGMVKLLALEAELLNNFASYANELEKKLEVVSSALAKMRAVNNQARLNTEEYLSNPINSFALIRRMQRDWTFWQLYMEQPIGEDQVDFVEQKRNQLPSTTDLEEAATAVHRIVATYDLQPLEMADGILNGKRYNVSWNALDTYALALYEFDQKNHNYASNWIYHAIMWLKQNELPEPLGLKLTEVQLVYVEALLQSDRYQDALQLLKSVIASQPNDARLLRRSAEIETLIRLNPNIKPKPFHKHTTSYEIGCRGQYPVKNKLHCTYNTTASPFLRLAPLKMELVRLDPYMVLFHDVISPSEIKGLQEMAAPNLKRATVFNVEQARNIVVSTRTSKVAWFTDGFNELTKRLNARIADMTGFEMYGSEMLQVMNYGLGGHYDKHHDYFDVANDTDIVRMNGNRIATVLFYLTDVEQGGGTVFPQIQEIVFPKRGAAIMWYNLKNDGQGDTNTLHAACPVIVGSKWVCNKWIRERHQFRRRPCFNQ